MKRIKFLITLFLILVLGNTSCYVSRSILFTFGLKQHTDNISINLEIENYIEENNNVQLNFSTFLGGYRDEGIVDMALDEDGNIVIVGHTYSMGFPVKNNFQQNFGGAFDAYVAKIAANGQSIVFASFIGGSSADAAVDVAIDVDGNIYVTGFTSSVNFPIKNAFNESLSGSADGFITKLSPDGELLYSTYFGGKEGDFLYGLGFDAENNFIFTGHTSSINYPITEDAFSSTFGGEEDCVLTIIDPTGQTILYSSFLGGTLTDMGLCGIIDLSLDEIVISGLTYSSDFDTTKDAIQSDLGGGMDAFVTIFSLTNKTLLYSTYFGGYATDRAFNIAYDSTGSLVFTGDTSSPNLPVTADILQENYRGDSDAYLAKLTPQKDRLAFSTYIGFSAYDFPNDFAFDNEDNIIIIGGTASEDFYITSNAYQNTLAGKSDVFVLKIDSYGETILYSTFLGGLNDDEGTMIALDAEGNIIIAGVTRSSDFPVSQALDPSFGGSQDIFLGRFVFTTTSQKTDEMHLGFISLFFLLIIPAISRKRKIIL